MMFVATYIFVNLQMVVFSSPNLLSHKPDKFSPLVPSHGLCLYLDYAFHFTFHNIMNTFSGI